MSMDCAASSGQAGAAVAAASSDTSGQRDEQRAARSMCEITGCHQEQVAEAAAGKRPRLAPREESGTPRAALRDSAICVPAPS